ncbi:MAG: hypothetical protein A3D65_04980 [Candidatus Lloydbacteria bacterium RIFCSPHIGHO2_02_FULL_50_13]|uniref:Uncharacterized protein n=1 Tax=Candidatus Lloydbacteria bacterium RIFCSPHIGHO2_02_FULL_50_13 TaxID=1798661 RepID=A0A1G2D4R1_9BACT|nr:MAG: hypothetical protein A3D65_04980 [Candidatus Lloydbacteria bacterium RIFCSPHIGHO2_02_FULL_50_13]
MTEATQQVGGEQHGPVYWLFAHMLAPVMRMFAAHRLAATVFFVVLVLTTLLFRETWQPVAVLLRLYAVPVAAAFLFLYAVRLVSKRARLLAQISVWLIALPLLVGAVAGYEYAALWVRYQSIKVETIDRLPETDHERIQPLASVHALTSGIIGDSRQPAPPDFVWMRNRATGAIEFQWTMGVAPKIWLDKIWGTVDEVITVSGTAPSLQFSSETKHPVRFTVGEELWLSSRAHTAAIRSFGPLKFFNYEPADVRYLRDDAGEIIQVISLLRWRGIFFPYPEFGGVLVIRQQKESSVGAFVERVALGAGEWISPERIQEFPYLRGQNIMSYRASRYIGESFRFMNGFMAPFPGYHQGDVRIPDSKESLNTQPYTVFFKETNGMPGTLYHYFSLEPFLEGKHGLVASVLIPADGTDRVFVYRHEDRNESLMGVSKVPGLVKNSKMEYDWNVSAAVEERPYVRYIDGKRRLLWLTTVVTYENAKKNSFTAGSVPQVALVDSATQEVIWVDPRDQAGWVKLLSK